MPFMQRLTDGGGLHPTTRSADFAALKSTLFDAAPSGRTSKVAYQAVRGEVCLPEQWLVRIRHGVAQHEASNQAQPLLIW